MIEFSIVGNIWPIVHIEDEDANVLFNYLLKGLKKWIFFGEKMKIKNKRLHWRSPEGPVWIGKKS